MIKPAYYLCIALCCAFNTATHAEDNWKKGYVVTATGDTVRGLITYNEYSGTPLEFGVKAGKRSAMKLYNVSNAKAVCIDLRRQKIYYQLFETEIDYSQVSSGWLDNTPDPVMVRRRIFLQLMVQGDKSLYYYNDTTLNKKHYLVEWPAGKATELVSKPYYTDNTQANIAYNQLYKKQLKDLYADCTTIAYADINSTVFTGDALRKLAEQYNSCNKSKARYEYKPERTTATLGVMAGGTSTSLVITKRPYLYPSMQPATSLCAGLFTNIFLPRMKKQLAICVEGTYSGYDMTSEATGMGAVKMTYLKAYAGIRYQHNAGKVLPFGQAGIANGFAITAQARPKIDVRTNEQSFYIGGGLRYRRLEAEARFEQGNGFSGNNSLRITTIRWAGLLKFYVF